MGDTKSSSARFLAPLYGGAEGPSGVLIGGEDWIEYLHEGSNLKTISAIPRRKLHPPGNGVLITQLAVHEQKKSKFFA
jgi:splicing factor 3B subunit 3